MRAQTMALYDQLKVTTVAYMRNSIGPRTERWGTPHVMVLGDKEEELTRTY